MQSAANAWLVWRALALFVFIDLLIWARGFQTAYDWTRRAAAWRDREDDELRAERIGRTVWAVRLATRYYYRRRLDCLPRALTTYRLLRSQGVPASLCLGVKKYPFAAHAWVEVAGALIDDSRLRIDHYTLLSRV
jgi:hypothetical protein